LVPRFFNRVLSLELFKVSRFPFGKAASYRLFLAFAASFDCSSANVPTIADANAANALGVGAATEGYAGQPP
jgi:hypothetical protein